MARPRPAAVARQGDTVPVEPGGMEAAAPRARMGLVRHMAHDPNASFGAVIVGIFVLAALLGPVLAPADPLAISPDRLHGPSADHLLGTDGLGRDILSRILYGARLSLGTAALAGLLVMTIGVTVGTLAGYFGGLVDSILMRVVDLILALPGLVLTFAIAGLLEPGMKAVVLGMVSVWWVGYARIVRSMVLSLREQPYVEAARAMGVRRLRVIRTHILPHLAPGVVVLVTLRMGRLILAIGGLSFLGLGAQPPTPEWGTMLNESRAHFPTYPHIMLAPGVAIALVVLGLNLLGDGLRDVLDPRLRSTSSGP